MVTVVAEGKHAISRVIDTYIAKQNKELLQLLKNLRKDKVAVRDPCGWLSECMLRRPASARGVSQTTDPLPSTTTA
jgi:hypothetical protein